MPMANSRRVYIDSCSFIEMVKVGIGKRISSERQQDVWHLNKLLEASRDKEIEVYTSTLTIAECSHAGDNPISQIVKDAFSSILMSGQYVRLVQTTPFIAESARDMRWVHNIAIKGADSVHVASALDRKCEELLTTNGRLSRLSAHQKNFEKLGLKIVAGRQTLCLPDKYRQLGLADASNSQVGQEATNPRVH